MNPQNSNTTLISSLSALLAAFFYSFSTVYIQKNSVNANKMVLIGWSIIFSAVIMLPVTIFYLPDAVPSAAAISSAIWLGAFSTGLGFIGYVRLIDKIGAVKTSTVAYFLPVFGIIWGAIFLDEAITSTIIIGCFIVLIGIYLSNSNKKGYVNSVNTKA
ncbi:MAG: DMT family permease [SAR86 cluster bacterium SAR86B]|uniref:DMT family permease n=1 Tax=SAR86 cluster bacterium SAR86B TaxID=1123867 RepID=J5KEW2_9GAMM|nr:MAG: DMT family permease [SAR86 cluster bacterium SAR86B]